MSAPGTPSNLPGAPDSTPLTNGYICFYNRGTVEVHAATSLAAQTMGHAHFQRLNPRRRIKPWDCRVLLSETNTQGGTVTGVQVTHLPLF